ncbi:MAG: hypothetical protein ABI867_20815 [Kofleriaceae bacterium]
MAESELDEVAALIVADPDANENYLVFADLLMRAGDLRGELIMLQHQLANGGTDRTLRIRGQKLLDNAQAALARALGTEPTWTWRLGFLRSITIAVGETTDRAGATKSS